MGLLGSLLPELAKGCTPPGLVLAQSGFGLIDPPAPRALEDPPLLAHYLVENPWPVAVVLAVAGVVVMTRLRGAGKAKEGVIAGSVLLAGAVGVWLLARFIETGRETITRSTSALVGAAARADIPALGTLLSDELSLFRPGGGPGLNKVEVLDRVQHNLGGVYRVREWAILESQAMTDSADSGVTQSRIRVTLEAAGFPNISWWRIDWRKGKDGTWRAVTIDPVSVTAEVRNQMR